MRYWRDGKGPIARIEFDIDDGVLARLHSDPGEFTRELRIAASVKWYERELVSQGRAARLPAYRGQNS